MLLCCQRYCHFVHVIWCLSASHIITGQFWNIPVTVSNYSGPLKTEHEADFDQVNLYLITIEPATGGKPRTFLGAWHELSWDMKSGKHNEVALYGSGQHTYAHMIHNFLYYTILIVIHLVMAK